MNTDQAVGSERKGEKEKARGEILTHWQSHMKFGVRKLLRTGLVPARG